jgi:hypothetical protein
MEKNAFVTNNLLRASPLFYFKGKIEGLPFTAIPAQ